jgi:transcriptional regulator with XRE-family HTH domain/uncharacterized pyridoxamine 5'-phosphate oxidase family protein
MEGRGKIMEKEQKLNLDAIKDRIQKKGLSLTALAKKLDVSKEIVSKWVSGAKFPRPLHLLQLAKELSLKFEEILIAEVDPDGPVIAYRKTKNSKLQQEHIAKAQEMGRHLRNLIPYLPFDISYKPATLLEPKNDFSYIQREAEKVRDSLKLKSNDVFKYKYILDLFGNYHTVLIPVLWGEQQKHDNALHIYLPDSATTWIYLNLNSNQYDFKFWMLHEYAHILATDLRGEEGEDFADAFAAELLFPLEAAGNVYHQIKNNPKKSVAIILHIAKQYEISPVTVEKQVNLFAKWNQLEKVKVNIYPILKNFNKNTKTIAEILFGSSKPSTADYIQISQKELKTSFFTLLRSFYKKEEFSRGFLQNLLNISFIDAASLLDEIKNGTN